MKLNLKVFLFLAILPTIILLTATYAFADDVTIFVSGLLDNLPVYSTVFPGSIGALLCDFRRLFCGSLTLTIAATAIFILGILILTRKAHWLYSVLMIICIIFFLNGELITDAVQNITILGIKLDLSIISHVCICIQSIIQ